MNKKLVLASLAASALAASVALTARSRDSRNPFDIFEQLLQNEFPTMMVLPSGMGELNPRHRTAETATEYIYEFDMPGRTNDEVNVEAEPESRLLHVSIKGRSSQHSENNKNGHVTRSYSSMHETSESFRLPPDADAKKLTASAENGLLTIRVGKMIMAENKGRIAIPVTSSVTSPESTSSAEAESESEAR